MASQRPASSLDTGKTYFEQQRELLIGDIGMSFEHVLANINKLNRSLEAIITVGNEFSSVEALWSQFEGVMGKEEAGAKGEGEGTKAEETTEVTRDETRDETTTDYGEEEEEEEEEETTVADERGRR